MKGNSGPVFLCGSVETPASLAEVRSELKQNAECVNGFALGTVITDEVAKAIEAPTQLQAVRLTVFTTPMGVAFLAVTLQVDSLQLRYVSSLSQPSVQELLRWSVKARVVQFVFEIADTGQVLFVTAPVRGADEVVLERLAQTSRVLPREEALHGLSSALCQLSAPGSIPSALPGVRVTRVLMVGVIGCDSTPPTDRSFPTIH